MTTVADEFTSGEIATAVEDAAKSSEVPPASGTQTPPVKSAAGTTVQPGGSAVDEHGPVPFERHEAILGKTRRDYEEQIGRLRWAERVDPDRARRAMEIAEMVDRRDPRLLEHFKRSAPEDMPQPDARDDRGEPFYSPEAAAKFAKWEAKQAIAEYARSVEDRLGPIEHTFAQGREYDALTTQTQAATDWPGFTEHIDLATKFLSDANARRARGESIPVYTLEQVYISQIVPKLINDVAGQIATAKKKWLDELNTTHVAAGGDADPKRGRPSSTRKADADKGWGELIEEEVAARRSA